MRRISRLALAVGIVAALLAASPAFANGPSLGHASSGTVVSRLVDQLLRAVFGPQSAGHSTDPNGTDEGHSTDPNGLDEGHSTDPDG
jgi:hypothetical protein